MTVLQTKRGKYIEVHYEWNRIIPFCFIYISVIIFSFLNKSINMFWEILISILIIVVTGLYLYLSINKTDKVKLKEFIYFK